MGILKKKLDEKEIITINQVRLMANGCNQEDKYTMRRIIFQLPTSRPLDSCYPIDAF